MSAARRDPCDRASTLRPGGGRVPSSLFTTCLSCLALVTLALAACQSGPPPRQSGPLPDAQQVLRLPLLTSQPITLDPIQVSDPASAMVTTLIYPALLALDAHMGVHPWAAESMDVSADGLTLTFHLRGDLRFSDGEAISAQTFAWSLNRALDPCSAAVDVSPLLMLAGAADFHQEQCLDETGDVLAGPRASLIGPDGPITVVDPLTLTLTLERPWMGALAALTAPVAFAVPQALLQQDGGHWTEHLADGGGLGGGLYRLAQAPGAAASGRDEARLTRNSQFWGAAPALREIDFYLYTSTASAWSDYQAGKLDAGYAPPAVAARGGAAFESTPLLGLMYLGFNTGAAPLSDAGLRQALALAIDKRSLAEDALGGRATPTNHLLVAGEPGYNPALVGPDQSQRLTGDPSRAVNLATAFASSKCAGQFSTCPPLVLEVATGDSDGVAAGAAIVRMWQAVAPGYPVQLDPEPGASLRERIASGAAQLYLDEWRPAYPDPSAWLDAAFGPGASGANASAATSDVRALLAQGQTEQDPAQRVKDYQAAEQLLVSGVAWLPLAQPQVFWQARPVVSGFMLDAQGALAVYDTAPTVVILRAPASGGA